MGASHARALGRARPKCLRVLSLMCLLQDLTFGLSAHPEDAGHSWEAGTRGTGRAIPTRMQVQAKGYLETPMVISAWGPLPALLALRTGSLGLLPIDAKECQVRAFPCSGLPRCKTMPASTSPASRSCALGERPRS